MTSHGPVTSQPASALAQSAIGGWLAPDGRMWRCTDQHHEDTAELIVQDLRLLAHHDAGDALVDAGWVRVSDNGLVLGARHLTQAQLDVLFDLARAHPSMRCRLMDELERARERSAGGIHPR